MNEKKLSKAMIAVYIVVAACLIVGTILFQSKNVGNGTMVTVDGFMGPLTVNVALTEGKITEAKIVKSTEGEFIAQSADLIFSKAITQGNANSIDIVAGATATSKALITALQQAYIEANTDETTLVGYGEGYRGPLSVIVTMEDDTITTAEILTISDSEFSTPTALAVLEQAVQLGNTDNLDVIAGATGTSKGLIDALKDAIAK